MPRFGVEYTFVPRQGCEEVYSDTVNKVREQLGPYGGRGPYEDDDCLEIPSPIHNNLEEAREFYDRMIKVVRRNGLTARRINILEDGSEEYVGTGGGHVHIELPGPGKMRKRVMWNLIAMVTNRPWLGWVFNEFMDDDNAQALIGREDVRKFMRGELRPTMELSWWGMNVKDPVEAALRGLCDGKDWAIRFKHWNERTTTVEFRFFDAPRSWGMAEDHIKFALAMFDLALRRAKENRDTGLVVGRKKSIDDFKNKRIVREEFHNTCNLLGLRWSRYEKYLANYDDRKRYGVLT